MTYLRTIATLIYTVVGTLLMCSTLIVLSCFDREGRLWWPVVRAWGWGVTVVTGSRPFLIRGQAHLAPSRACVLMANHRSHVDPPALMARAPRPIRFLTKHTLFYIPVFGQAMWMTGQISINRSDQKRAFESIEAAARSIAGGKSLLVFPEGTRSRTQEMRPFKKGGFVLAIKSRAPIVPIGIAGTGENVPKGWHWTERGPVTIVVGAPIATAGVTLDDKEALIDEVRDAILGLRAEAYAWRAEILAQGAREGEAVVE